MVDLSSASIRYSPEAVARRQTAPWRGLKIELVEVTRRVPFEYGLRPPVHLLIASERAARDDGETYVEGLPRSTRREFSGKLTFVPAGHEFHGWQEPRLLARAAYIFIDPQASWLAPELRFGEVAFAPRLFFDDADLWDTAVKLRTEAASPSGGNQLYAEALGAVLSHELIRLNNGRTPVAMRRRGGLAAWQQKAAEQYIDEHLAEPISLASLAELARLSPFHFARAFKQSFAMPPHRFHTMRRVELAKTLLSRPGLSVTEIAMRLGFSDTSSFSVSFRKVTGRTPSDFRRSLV